MGLNSTISSACRVDKVHGTRFQQKKSRAEAPGLGSRFSYTLVGSGQVFADLGGGLPVMFGYKFLLVHG